MYNRELVVILLFVVTSSRADVTGRSLANGACLCVSGSGVNVRSTACGSVIGQVNSGACYRYLGQKTICSLNGRSHDYINLAYNSGGWVAGTYLNVGSVSQCATSSSGSSGSSGPSGSSGSSGSGGAPATGGCPRVITRAEWGARPPRSTTANRKPIPKFFVHHSESGFCTTQAECARVIRGIQNYHMDNKDKRWPDIGYNFLVGEDGQVYEGQGWDRVGTQVLNYNSVSIGGCFVGNFTSRSPNQVALNAMQQLIACGVSLRKLSPSYTLHGHRDGRCTTCPGNSIYATIQTWPHYGGRVPHQC